MSMRLLLASNSSDSNYDDGGYLDYVGEQLDDFLGDVKEVLIVPHALFDCELFVDRARRKFAESGRTVRSLHEVTDPHVAISEAKAVFVGGGNTLRLLARLIEMNVLDDLRSFIASGRPYIGSSAGSILCGPSIGTTNDMPIVHPPSLGALNVVPFHINPHYIDPLPLEMYHGESREMRLLEFLEENPTDLVVALRESAMLRIEAGQVQLLGRGGGRLFRAGESPEELEPGTMLTQLLSEWN